MVQPYKKISLALLLLIGASAARLPFERPLEKEMRTAGLLAEPLDQQTSEAIGQTSALIALGGLRSLVAAVLNFSKIVPAWSDQDWLSIFNTFEQIHTLQPKTSYYWEAAAGYSADDAYSDYRDRAGLTDAQRRLRRDELFHKGVNYLDKGIHHNPQNLGLRKMKARILSDTYKPEHLDYAAATEVLDQALELDSATSIVKRQHVYLMSRVPERQREALAGVRELYRDPSMRFPSVKSLLFVLQKKFPDDSTLADLDLYRTEAELVRALFNHLQRSNEGLPVDGIEETLQQYLEPMELPYALNPMENKDIKRVTLKISRLLDVAPFQFTANPFTEPGSWPLVVRHFEEYRSQSLPTIRTLFFVLQNLTNVEEAQKVPLKSIFPDDLTAIRDLANFQLDLEHNYPRHGVEEALTQYCAQIALPSHLSPVQTPKLFPLNSEWVNNVRQWQIENSVHQ